jgi:hypothetical protein
MGVGGRRLVPAALPTGNVPSVQEAGWSSGPVWTGAENLATKVIRSPDPPARSEPLWRLSYAGPPAQLRVLLPFDLWQGVASYTQFGVSKLGRNLSRSQA